MVQLALLPFPLLLRFYHRFADLSDDNWTAVRALGQIALRCRCADTCRKHKFAGNEAEACEVAGLSAYRSNRAIWWAVKCTTLYDVVLLH